MTSWNDDWLDRIVRPGPDPQGIDADVQREAAEVGAYFRRRQAEDAAPLDAAAQAAREARMMAYLRKKGAFAAPVPLPVQVPLATPPLATPPLATPPLATPRLATPRLATPPGPAGPIERLRSWIGGLSRPQRMAWVTAVLAVVIAVPVGLEVSLDRDQDFDAYRGPVTIQQLAPDPGVGPAARRADDLVAALQGVGVAARHITRGPRHRLEAQVPDARRDEVAALLKPLGLVVPADGFLVIDIH